MVHDRSCLTAYAEGVKIACNYPALSTLCLNLLCLNLGAVSCSISPCVKSILVRAGKLERENACTCLRWPWGCIPHLEFSWLVMWLVSRTLALAAGVRENSWCVAVAMTQTHAFSQTNRRWHSSFMAAGHARASRPNNGGTLRSKNNAHVKLSNWSGLCAWILRRPVVHIL